MTVGTILSAGFGTALVWGLLESRRLRVVETEFGADSLPEEFEGFRIALLSGLHLRGEGPRLRKIAAALGDLAPNVLLLAGNVKPSHRTANSKVHARLARFLDRVKPPEGVFAVRGYRDRKRFWDELPSDSPVTLLSNSHATVLRGTSSIQFLGIQTAHASHLDRGLNQLRETLDSIPEKGFRILLGQSADLLRVAQGRPIDLILAGDNLHYQVRIPGIGVPRRDTKVPISWERGWIREGNLYLYLTTGIGVRWHPFRFFLRPEIVCITLRRSEPDATP